MTTPERPDGATATAGISGGAGPALDGVVAHLLFGWTVEAVTEPGFDFAVRAWAPGREEGLGFVHAWNRDNPTTLGAGDVKSCLPRFSTDMPAAWRIVEATGEPGHWNWHLSQEDTTNPDRRWFAEVCIGYATSYSVACPVWAATAPLAICKAALEAASHSTR